MEIALEKTRQQPDFGGNRIGEIQQTGDKEQDFNNAMVALRDDNYEAFIDDLNTLTGDPKVKNLRDAIVDKFNSKDGVQVFFSSETAMPIRNIHPTQFEVDMEKSLSYPLQKKPAGLVDILAGEKPLKLAGLPLVVAEIEGTNYIIDGHHRWSQVYCLNPDAKMIVRILKSDMIQHPDDALKLVQMEIFVAKDGKELPQSKVESGYNLYTIDEKSFKKWCQNTMTDDAKRVFDKMLSGKDPIEYMWNNVETMRKEAKPTSNAHGREDMPQTDQVDGEFISPRAEEVSENTEISKSNKRKPTMKKLNVTKERFEKSRYFTKKYGKLAYVSESGKLFKTNKGKVLMFKEYTDGYEGLERRPNFDPARETRELIRRQIKDGGGVVIRRTNKIGDLWTIQTSPEDPRDSIKIVQNIKGLDKARKYAKDHHWKVLRTIPKDVGAINESIGDVATDPALVCPYCGGNNCEVSIGSDDLNFTNLDRLQGETFNIECWCNDCNKPYNVTIELNVKDVYPNEDFSDEYI